MKDALLDFGKLSAFAASSAATYCENTLDLGANTRAFGSGITAKVVFTCITASTGFTPCIYTGSTSTPTTLVAQGSTISSFAVGDTAEVIVPLNTLRYLRAGGTATATTGSVSAHIELGGVEA